MSVRWPEVKLWFLPLSLPILFFEAGSLIVSGAHHQLAKLLWSFGDPLISVFPVLVLQPCTEGLIIFVGAGDLKSGLHTCAAKAVKPTGPPL